MHVRKCRGSIKGDNGVPRGPRARRSPMPAVKICLGKP